MPDGRRGSRSPVEPLAASAAKAFGFGLHENRWPTPLIPGTACPADAQVASVPSPRAVQRLLGKVRAHFFNMSRFIRTMATSHFTGASFISTSVSVLWFAPIRSSFFGVGNQKSMN